MCGVRALVRIDPSPMRGKCLCAYSACLWSLQSSVSLLFFDHQLVLLTRPYHIAHLTNAQVVDVDPNDLAAAPHLVKYYEELKVLFSSPMVTHPRAPLARTFSVSAFLMLHLVSRFTCRQSLTFSHLSTLCAELGLDLRPNSHLHATGHLPAGRPPSGICLPSFAYPSSPFSRARTKFAQVAHYPSRTPIAPRALVCPNHGACGGQTVGYVSRLLAYAQTLELECRRGRIFAAHLTAAGSPIPEALLRSLGEAVVGARYGMPGDLDSQLASFCREHAGSPWGSNVETLCNWLGGVIC